MIGNSGAHFFMCPGLTLLDALFPGPIAEQNRLDISTRDGRLFVSARVRSRDGLVVDIVNSEWKSSTQAFDKNYSDNAFEIKDSNGEIVFQLLVSGNVSYLQGFFFDKEGNGVGFVDAHDVGDINNVALAGTNGVGRIIPISKDYKGPLPRIKPLFKYPGPAHIGVFEDGEPVKRAPSTAQGYLICGGHQL